jgi:isopenicillin-N N-acyltransferase like protein
MFKKLLKILFRGSLILVMLLILFFVYFIFAVQIDYPKIKDNSALKRQRIDYSPTFYKVESNWLKQSESGLWELYVEGNGFERGAANGYLTKELAEKQEEAFIKQIQVLVPDLNYLKFLRFFVGYFNRHLPDHIIQEYQEEIYGISRFASDKYDFIAEKYHRILNYHGAHDIGHALQDKNMTVGCTSFGVWNKNSSDGELLIGRNFDFYSGDEFAQNKIVQFTNPKQGYKFATITWAGFIGAASGMNEKGITVTINAAKSEIPTGAATPIALLAREILQYAKNIAEAKAIIEKRKVFVSESILVGSAEDKKAVIFEKTPSKMDVYENGEDRILCSNHYQGKEMGGDAANIKNIVESSSFYRRVRLDQLLKGNQSVDYLEAAAILRDQKGINDKNIGLNNEKAMNQLIAHHGVIFKPERGLMWVSTAPFQCGKFVCYDLNKVFNEYKDLSDQEEIVVDSLTIPEDPFVKTKEYRSFLFFKELKNHLVYLSKHPLPVPFHPALEKAFLESNPESYYTYQVLGDYYKAKKEYTKAIHYYEIALGKEVATNKEADQIRESLAFCKNPVKK